MIYHYGIVRYNYTSVLIIVYHGSHGDMLYLDAIMSATSPGSMATQPVKQDEVDNILQDKDGRIHREMNPQL